ncbi:MAG: integrase [Verrucomicrobiota bacterium]
MPESILRAYPNAAREWSWQYVFASATLWVNPRTRRVARHHLHQDSMARRFREAALKSGIPKPVSPNLLRHCFDSRLLKPVPTSAPFKA